MKDIGIYKVLENGIRDVGTTDNNIFTFDDRSIFHVVNNSKYRKRILSISYVSIYPMNIEVAVDEDEEPIKNLSGWEEAIGVMDVYNLEASAILNNNQYLTIRAVRPYGDSLYKEDRYVSIKVEWIDEY